jgi:hypothetical protein
MKLSFSRSSVRRTAIATVLATATLSLGLPGIAHANEGDRSVRITVDNQTSEDFELKSLRVKEGKTSVTANDEIPAGTDDFFITVSDEDEGGTKGSVRYEADGEDVVIKWNNPWDDESEFDCDVPSGWDCDFDEDGSAEAELTFTITD